jgi:hypothetical protein
MNHTVPFSFDALGFDTGAVFYARLGPGICKQEHLLQALYHLLWFPGDCLTDLSWITEKRVVLEHAGLPDIPETDLKIYLEILRDAVMDWNPEDGHCFEVVFNAIDKNRVTELLKP